MNRHQVEFTFLNLGHLYDHYVMLIFATVAALVLATEWDMGYGELVPYATPGFIAFGVVALPAGWIADKWSRHGMMAIFFFGIGFAAIATSFAETPLAIAAGLFMVGVFAAIYHPVGIAMVVQGRVRTGVPLAINGVFGNLGVAVAALATGYLIDALGWRAAFLLPGVVCIATGIAYLVFLRTRGTEVTGASGGAKPASGGQPARVPERALLVRIFAVIFFSTALGGLIFQSTTFALPKIFDERLADLAVSATLVGWYVFVVFSVAAAGQVIVGYFVDRYPARTVFALTATAQCLLFFVMRELSGLAALAVAIGFMLAVFGQIPINDVLLGRVTRGEWRSRAYAIRYLVTFGVMASAIPLIGWVHTNWGFVFLFDSMTVAAGAILLAALLLPRAIPRV